METQTKSQASNNRQHLYTPIAIVIAGLMIAGATFVTNNPSFAGQITANVGGEVTVPVAALEGSVFGPELYREIAQAMNVNLGEFDTCVNERRYKEKVENDQREGSIVGISGTPGGFVNGTPVRGAIPYAQLKSMIDAELANL